MAPRGSQRPHGAPDGDHHAPEHPIASACCGACERDAGPPEVARGPHYFEPLLPASRAATTAQLEGEADRVADAAMLRPLRTPVAGAAPRSEQPALDAPRLGEARDGGRQLDASARSFAESRLGHSFAGVRIHTDAGAAARAAALNARAYAVGQHVVFGAGEYQPQTRMGQRLLLHELVHTLQMARPGVRPWIARTLQNNCSDGQDGTMLRQIGLAAETVDHAIFLLTGRLKHAWYVDASESDRIDCVFNCPTAGVLQTLIDHLGRVRGFLDASFPYSCRDGEDDGILVIHRALSETRMGPNLQSFLQFLLQLILRHALLLAGTSWAPELSQDPGLPTPSPFSASNYLCYLMGEPCVLLTACPSQPSEPSPPTPAEPSRQPQAMTSNDIGLIVDAIIVVSRVGGQGAVTGWDWEPRGAEHLPSLGPRYEWYLDPHRDRIYISVDGQRLDLLHNGRVASSGPGMPASGTPASGTPASGTPAPGTPAPGSPAPGPAASPF